MRLFIIPISTRRALIYSRTFSKGVSQKVSLTDRITSKVAETWARWEEADKGWKKHLVSWGNRVQQRIPFEEWGLKSIPSFNAQQRLDLSHGSQPVDVLFPGNAIKEDKLHSVLRTIATERQDLHRKRMWWSCIAAPITAPIGLIPLYVPTNSEIVLSTGYVDSNRRNFGCSIESLMSLFSTLHIEAGRIGEVCHWISTFHHELC